MKNREIIQKILGDTTRKETFLFQQEVLGFSFIFLQRKHIKNMLRNLYKRRNGTLSAISSLFLIPHVYIFPLVFGGIALNGTLTYLLGTDFIFGDTQIYHLKQLILDLCLYSSIFLVLLYLYRKVFSKVSWEIKSALEFSYTSDPSLRELEGVRSFINQKNQVLRKSTSLKFFSKLGFGFEDKGFIFLFSQPFIFGHGFLFGGFSFFALIIFDIFIYLILSKKIKGILFYIAYVYFIVLSYIYDYFPYFCSEKIKNRYFFLQLHNKFNKLNISLNLLESNIKSLEKGVLEKEIGLGFSGGVQELYGIYTLTQKSKILKDKQKLQKLIDETIEESIREYNKIFQILKERFSKEGSLYGHADTSVKRNLEKFEKIEKKLNLRIINT